MSSTLKIFEKCRDTKCGDVFTKKELNAAKKSHIKDVKQKCGKEKDMKKQIACSLSLLNKSKYKKLLSKRGKCAELKCKKEQQKFRKDFFKKIRSFKNKSNKSNRSKSSSKLKKSKKSN